MSMGRGEFTNEGLDDLLGFGTGSRFKRQQFNQHDINAMSTAPFLYNKNEGLLDADLINDYIKGGIGGVGEEQEPLTIPKGEFTKEESLNLDTTEEYLPEKELFGETPKEGETLSIPKQEFVQEGGINLGTTEEYSPKSVMEGSEPYSELAEVPPIEGSVEPIVEPSLPFVPEQFYDVLNTGGGVAGDVSEKKETNITFNVEVDFKNAPSNIDQRDFTEQLNKKLKDLPFMQNLNSLLKIGSDITNDF
jgi:hypothetical protein